MIKERIMGNRLLTEAQSHWNPGQHSRFGPVTMANCAKMDFQRSAPDRCHRHLNQFPLHRAKYRHPGLMVVNFGFPLDFQNYEILLPFK